MRVSRVSRPSVGNLLERYEDPSDLLECPTGKNSIVVLVVLLAPLHFGHKLHFEASNKW